MISDDVDIFLGLDVGKTDHWACSLDRSGKRLWNKFFLNEEPKLIALFQQFQVHGTVLVIVDQPATIGGIKIRV